MDLHKTSRHNGGVRVYVALTDGEWYRYLAERSASEANFWQPSGGRQFRALRIGEPFLFKTHYPQNKIVGIKRYRRDRSCSQTLKSGVYCSGMCFSSPRRSLSLAQMTSRRILFKEKPTIRPLVDREATSRRSSLV